MATLATVQVKVQAALDEVIAAQILPLPAISNMAATPSSLPIGGGPVTVSATVTGATTLTLDGAAVVLPVTVQIMTNHTFVLVATNAAGSVSANASVTVAAPAGSVPLWLQGKAIGEWVSIPNTAMSNYDLTAINAAGLNPGQWLYGNPVKGIFANSGGCIGRGNTLFVFGGGGAGGWAGNEIRMLDLSQDAPAWATLALPSNASAVYDRNQVGQTPHAYMKDGKPNARHSYRQPHFITANNEFMAFGCTNVWETDSTPGTGLNVDSYNVAAGAWNPQATNPPIPCSRWWDGNLTLKHPITEDVYALTGGGAGKMSKWSRATNAWSLVCYISPGMDKAFGAIDPNTGTAGMLLRIGPAQSGFTCHAFDLANGSDTRGNLVGPYASVLETVDDYTPAFGMDYDLILHKFIAYRCTQQLLTVTPQGEDWYVDLYPTNGTPPVNDPTMNPGGVLGRFGYLPALKGFGWITPTVNGTQNTFFVRTA